MKRTAPFMLYFGTCCAGLFEFGKKELKRTGADIATRPWLSNIGMAI